MTEDSGQQPPPAQTPPPYPSPPPPPSGENPYLGYVPGQPYPPAGQPGWPQPTPAYVVPVRPDLPKATAAMVVGIVAVAGGFVLCGLPLLLSPVAWALGAQARRQVREAPQQWDGEGKATAGLVLGVIGTVLLVLALILVVVLIIVAVNGTTTIETDTGV